jgi:hypothetical protein
MTYNANNRKDIRRAEKAAALEQEKRVNFIVAAMSTEQGRAWFHRLLSDCRIFSDPFTGDALLEAHNKGERNIGLRVFADIMANCPSYYVTMMTEANIKDITDERRAESDSDDDTDYADGSTSGGEHA